MSAAIELMDSPLGWHIVCRHITYYASKSWGYCQKTYETIAKETNVSITTVERVMRYLKQHSLASIRRMGRDASRIYVTDELKEWISKRFRPNDGSKTGRTPNTIYKKKKDDSADKVLDEMATPEEAEKIKSRMVRSGTSIWSISNPVKYFDKALHNLRCASERVFRKPQAQRMCNTPVVDEKLLEKVRLFEEQVEREIQEEIKKLGS